MKKNIILHFIFFVFLLMSCTDQDIDSTNLDRNKKNIIPGRVSLTLDIPDLSTVMLRSRIEDKSIDETRITSLHVVTYTSDSVLSEVIDITTNYINGTSEANNKRKIELNLSKPLSSLHIVANVADLETRLVGKDLDDLFIEQPPSQAPFVMWGKCENIEALIDNSAEIPLYHNVVKTTIEENLDNFEILYTKLCQVAKNGSITPKKITVGTVNIQADGKYVDLDDSDKPITYFYETASTANTRMLIKAKYQGKDYFYSVAFNNSVGKGIDLIRNHYYKIIVVEVKGAGYSKEEDAINNPPSNVLRVQIIDQNPAIKDLITDGQFVLGVSDTIYVDNNEQIQKAYIVSSLHGSDISRVDALYSTPEITDWIKVNKSSADVINQPSIDGITVQAIMVTFDIDIQANNKSDQQRVGKIVFRSGGLERNLYVVQKGKDLKLDISVAMYLKDNLFKPDYWSFLSEIKGTKADDMNGTVRNQGLHFSVMKNEYSYKIKHNPSDTYIKKSNGDKFTISESNNEWTIELVDNNPVNDTWVGSFTIYEGDLSSEIYVYRTGILHEDNGLFQGTTKKKQGWFYYELVKIGSQYWLDRNLGASSNEFYSCATNSHQDQNPDAVGGYYQIFNPDNTTLDLCDPCPEGFKIPDVMDFEVINSQMNIELRTTPSGENYYRPEIKISNSSLLKQEIYLPLGKYRDNDVEKGNISAYYWTSTKVSGTQGFDTGSPEFGYWYRYFNITGKNASFSNLRITNGFINTANPNPISKGLNIRCVRK